MSTKDYELIAGALKSVYRDETGEYDQFTVERCAIEIGRALASQNERFSRLKFYDAIFTSDWSEEDARDIH